MSKISVVISAFNEEKKLPECLASVSFADEIIVIDNQSTDRTTEIAKKYKAKTFSKPNNLMLNINKNFGFTKATGDWILNLDADERVSDELKLEIEKAIAADDQSLVGFQMPRRNIIFGKWIRHTGWYPDYQVRLFRRGQGKFAEQHVHEKLDVTGGIRTLEGNIVHQNYDTIMQFMQKMCIIYAPNEAEQLLKNGYKFSYADAIRFPVREFIGRFFAQKGYKDGFHGLMLSFLMAFYHFVVFATIWEKKKFVDEDVNSPDLFLKEFNKSKHELSYWSAEQKIEATQNPLQRLYFKFVRKVSDV